MSVRIQFDITDELWNRMSKYVPDYKSRHSFAKLAVGEWINRKEARVKEIQMRRIKKEAEFLKPIIEDVLKRHGMMKDE